MQSNLKHFAVVKPAQNTFSSSQELQDRAVQQTQVYKHTKLLLWKHSFLPKPCLKPQPLLTADRVHSSFLPHQDKCLVLLRTCINLAHSNKSLLAQKKEYPSG